MFFVFIIRLMRVTILLVVKFSSIPILQAQTQGLHHQIESGPPLKYERTPPTNFEGSPQFLWDAIYRT